MTVAVSIPPSLNRFLGCMNPAGRKNLFSAAANALKLLVQGHLRKEAPRRHNTARRLGGTPTNLLQKGAARASFAADANHGEVSIPMVGLNRALGDVTITPKSASALTLPLHGSAYGHRVAELRRMGWTIFRPKGKTVLMGTRSEKDAPVSLYALVQRVTLRQDRSLLPSDEQINSTVASAMMAEIERVARKAG